MAKEKKSICHRSGGKELAEPYMFSLPVKARFRMTLKISLWQKDDLEFCLFSKRILDVSIQMKNYPENVEILLKRFAESI